MRTPRLRAFEALLDVLDAPRPRLHVFIGRRWLEVETVFWDEERNLGKKRVRVPMRFADGPMRRWLESHGLPWSDTQPAIEVLGTHGGDLWLRASVYVNDPETGKRFFLPDGVAAEVKLVPMKSLPPLHRRERTAEEVLNAAHERRREALARLAEVRAASSAKILP